MVKTNQLRMFVFVVGLALSGLVLAMIFTFYNPQNGILLLLLRGGLWAFGLCALGWIALQLSLKNSLILLVSILVVTIWLSAWLPVRNEIVPLLLAGAGTIPLTWLFYRSKELETSITPHNNKPTETRP